MADPGFAKGGGTMASARSANLNGGLEAEPPAGSRGRAPGGGSGGQSPLVHCHTQMWPKLRTALTIPKFWSMGGGASQGSFPAGTPGNGVPKVIFTVGTAFPGIQ